MVAEEEDPRIILVNRLELMAWENTFKKWNHIFIFTNSVLLILGISLILLILSLESYWNMFYPFLNIYKELHGVGVLFSGCALCITAVFGFVIMCTKHSSHFIWYGLSLLIVLILDTKVIISSVVDSDIAGQFVEKSLYRGMINYRNNTQYSESIDNVHLTLSCCGVHNYTEWWEIPGGFIPWSCCPSMITIKNYKNSEDMCEIFDPHHFFTEPCLKKLLQVPVLGLMLICSVIVILVCLKILTIMLAYRMEKIYKEYL